MTRVKRNQLLKVILVVTGGIWRAVMIPSWVEIMLGLTPYLMIVSAWSFLKRPWLIGSVIAVVGWSDVSACLAARRAMDSSSMGGVALIMQFLFASCVVGAAVLLTFLFPPRSRKRPSRAAD